MANGGTALIEQIRKILEEEGTIPQSVTNKLVLAAIIESYRTREARFDQLEGKIAEIDCENEEKHRKICGEMDELRADQRELKVIIEERQKNAITVGWVLEKFGIPIMMLVIAGLVSAWVSGAFN